MHLRAYLLGTVRYVKIDGNSQLVPTRQPPKGMAHTVLHIFAPYILPESSLGINFKIQEKNKGPGVVPFFGQFQ